jgi:hypothetical protein
MHIDTAIADYRDDGSRSAFFLSFVITHVSISFKHILLSCIRHAQLLKVQTLTCLAQITSLQTQGFIVFFDITFYKKNMFLKSWIPEKQNPCYTDD